MPSIVERIINGINKITAIFCVVLLAVLVVVSGMQVYFRYILQEPLIWSEEAARYLLIWLSFAAAGLVLNGDGHPRIEVLPAFLPPRVQAGIDLAVQALVAVFLVVFVYVATELAQRYLAFNSLGTGMSQAVPRYALPIGGALMLANLLPKVGATLAILFGRERPN